MRSGSQETGPGFVANAGDFFTGIALPFTFGENFFRRKDGGILVVAVIQQGPSRLVWRCVLNIVGDQGPNLWVQNIVDKFMRIHRMRRILWNAQVIRPDQGAFLGDDVVDVVIFKHDLTDIAGVVDAAMTEIGRCYTMARERTVHAAHAVFTETDKTDEATTTETAGETAAAEDEFDDLLF